MSNLDFPALAGLKWSVKRTPQWATTVQTGRTGKEIRLQEQDAPIWHWDMGYEILSDDRSAGLSDLQKLCGFYLAHKGAWDSFLLTDPDDNAVVDEVIGTGTGAQVNFQLARSWGGLTYSFLEPIKEIVGSPVVKVNGSTVTASLGSAGVVTCAAAPANGTTVTATFSYKWRVRFKDDSLGLEQFARQMWEAKSVALVSVL
jgi:uncharacterized protein (TIGR02217 family)